MQNFSAITNLRRKRSFSVLLLILEKFLFVKGIFQKGFVFQRIVRNIPQCLKYLEAQANFVEKSKIRRFGGLSNASMLMKE